MTRRFSDIKDDIIIEQIKELNEVFMIRHLQKHFIIKQMVLYSVSLMFRKTIY